MKHQITFRRLFSSIILLGCTSACANADTLYVRAGATASGDGSSWANAFANVSNALAAAQAGDEVWIAAGTYTPVDALSSFVMKSGVRVYGGFAGTELQLTERDPATHLTVFSGDIGQDDTIDTSPFAPAWPNNVNLHTPNAGHVVVASGVDATAVLDGVQVIKGAYGPSGFPAGDPIMIGGGLYCVGGSPTIKNCLFSDNFASFGHGGAMHLANASPTISNCTFTRNLAWQGSGGAIYVGARSQPVIQDCDFNDNLAVGYSGQTGQGGAVQLDASMPITVARCTFNRNISRPFGGASFEIPRGGAISSFCIYDGPLTTTIRECVFRGNQSTLGGGLFAWNPTTVINCLFHENTSGSEGAGIASQWTTLTLINSTVINNTGSESGGVLSIGEAAPFVGNTVVRNSIIWDNHVTGQGVSPRNISIRGSFSARNSCIEHLFTVDPGEDPVDPANYPGCIITNPSLDPAPNAVGHLLSGSPCVDAGNPSFVPTWVVHDIASQSRSVRGLPGAGPAVIDMGCWELASSASCLPVVTVRPQSQEICSSASATFAVIASSGAPLSYQWRRNGVNIAGATSPTLVRSGSATNAAGTYDCMMTTACGSVLTPPAQLSIGLGFQVVSEPQSITACAGQPLSFSIYAEGWRTISYQWKKDGAVLSGETNAGIDIASVSPSHVGVYTCDVSSECGTVMSAPVSVSISGSVPLIEQQTTSIQACVGSTAQFSVSLHPLGGPFQFEWYFGNLPADLSGDTRFSHVESSDGFTTTFSIERVTSNDASENSSGQFFCFVTEANGGCNIALSTPVWINVGGENCGSTCDSIDFNNDTSLFDPQDIDAFLSVYSEGPCIPNNAMCNDIDFNNDGSLFDPCDIDSFLLQFSEGPCSTCGQ